MEYTNEDIRIAVEHILRSSNSQHNVLSPNTDICK